MYKMDAQQLMSSRHTPHRLSTSPQHGLRREPPRCDIHELSRPWRCNPLLPTSPAFSPCPVKEAASKTCQCSCRGFDPRGEAHDVRYLGRAG
jgi:hypothetical protein